MRSVILGIFLVVGSGIAASADSPPVVPKCETNADCVPAQCCHPTGCVHKSQAPDCTNVACTMDCRPNTLDCQNGRCECDAGSCKAVMKDK